MKKETQTDMDDLRPEYDFSNAVRGKGHKSLHKGYTVHIHQADGPTLVNHYTLADGTVMLEPDVQEYFPDSESVNAALRSLIALLSEMPDTSKRLVTRKGHS